MKLRNKSADNVAEWLLIVTMRRTKFGKMQHPLPL